MSETEDKEQWTHRFREQQPTTKGFFGDPIPHPEFVGTTCAECGKYGYLPEAAADVAREEDAEIVCRDCG